MKLNKKLIVASLSTAIGLGIVGSITGTVAWYRYSAQTTTSIVGVSVGQGGAFSVSLTNNGDSSYHNTLGTSDIYSHPTTRSQSSGSLKFHQATFGKMNNDGSLPTYIDDSDPLNPVEKNQAYLQPEVGQGELSNWERAENTKDYIQFDLYFRAIQKDANGQQVRVARDIYLSDITIKDLDNDKVVSDAVRIHMQDKNDPTINYLFAKNAGTDVLGAKLDLDGDGHDDKVGGYQYNDDEREDCKYGQWNGNNPLENAIASADSLKSTFDDEGNLSSAGSFVTQTTVDGSPMRCFTITIWLEGWHQFNGSSVWSGDYLKNTRDANFFIGLTFDAGNFAA